MHTPLAVTGEEALPRMPMPLKGAASVRPLAFASTSQMLLAPSVANGLLDHTYESA